jgi:hypothetical protein
MRYSSLHQYPHVGSLVSYIVIKAVMLTLANSSAILNAGYKVSGSHCSPKAIKTNAPSSVVWDILRAYVKTNPVVMANISKDDPARNILAKEPT